MKHIKPNKNHRYMAPRKISNSKIILLSIVLTFTGILHSLAQEYKYVPFPDSNAIWSEVFWKPIDELYPRWDYNKFALLGEDTLINNNLYHKLFHTHNSSITLENSTCIGGIREDSLKRVWFYCFNFPYNVWKPALLYIQDEIMLYDFSVSVGDTIRDVNFMLEYEYLVVKQIDTIQVYNTKRKVLSFQLSDFEGYNFWVHWIEGIGNTKGLLFTSGDLPTNGMDNDLVCMHKNDTLQFYSSGPDNIYDDCVPQFVLNGVKLFPNTDIKVYPNPVTNGIIYFEGLDFELFELFDIQGTKILEENIKGKNIYKLTTIKLSPGLYQYKLTSKGFIPTYGKFVIQ